MSLLDDLPVDQITQALSARGDFSAALQQGDLGRLLDEGAAAVASGDLGRVLGAAGDLDLDALVAPILAGLGDLLGALDIDLPLGDLASAVAGGAERVVALVGTGDEATVAGLSVERLVAMVPGPLGGLGGDLAAGLHRLTAALGPVAGADDGDPRALLELVLELGLPVPAADLRDLRGHVGASLGAVGRVRLDAVMGSGLVAALDRVRAAADAGDQARLAAALADVARVRAATVANLTVELRRLAALARSLPTLPSPDVLGALAGGLRTATGTVLAELDEWRARLAEVRALVASIDPAQGLAAVLALLATVEAEAQRFVTDVVDAGVAELAARLRALFRDLPHRRLRQELTDALHGLALRLTALDLAGPAEDVLGGLRDAEAFLSSGDLGAAVQDALGPLGDAIHDAATALQTAVDTVVDAVQAAADQVAGVLQQVTGALAALRAAVDAVVAVVESNPLDQAQRDVVAALHEIRVKAEQLLSAAPLPEQLRPVVDGLVDTLEGIDVAAAVGEPLHAVAEQLNLPPEAAATVTDGLGRLADAVKGLVPAQLVADLDAELQAVVSQLDALDPSVLTDGLRDLLSGAADALASLVPDLRAALAPVEALHQQLLAAVDAVHPRRLLAPVIEAYQSVMGAIRLPDATGLLAGLAGAVDTAGTAAVGTLTAPMARLADGGPSPTGPSPTGASPSPGTVPASTAPASRRPVDPAAEVADLRPGDVIRVLGLLPQRARTALGGLDTSALDSLLAEVGGLLAGLAADLRAVRAAVLGLEDRLVADLHALLDVVGDAQVDALLALQVHAQTGPVGFDLDASLLVVAGAGPAPLLVDLDVALADVRAATATAAGAFGSVALEDLAEQLSGSPLAGLVADTDAFLAALDPEPLAAEMDALVAQVLATGLGALDATRDAIVEVGNRLRGLLAGFDPGMLLQRFFPLVLVLRDELSVLDPERLADELAEVHGVLRAAVAAYDPERFVAEVEAVAGAAVERLRTLDVADLLPDLSTLQAAVAELKGFSVAAALDGVGAGLAEVGDELVALDVAGLFDAVNQLPDQVAAAIEAAVTAVRDEVVALLRAIQFSGGGASASASVSVTT